MTGQTRINGTTNGTKRPDVPTWGPLTTIRLGGIPAEAAPEPAAHTSPVAAAEAEAIRARAYAEAEAARIGAEAEAEAVRIKAATDAKRQEIANAKAAMVLEEKRAEHEAKLADLAKVREQAERETALARREAEAAEGAAAAEQEKRGKSATSWRRAALTFAVVCAIVALPVQMSAFYSRTAPWLLAAPLVLEGGAWVVLKGAAAAVDDHRPHWHYRLIAWLLAFLAAAINLSHGLAHFGAATASGTAFASLAGPGVWDLHEHGRIRTRDGKLTRRQQRDKRVAEKRAATVQAAERKRAEAEKLAADKAARDAAGQLAAEREKTYPKEWQHALALAAALGETTVTEPVWRRAWYDIHGTEPGDSVDTIRTRRTAETRVATARGETPPNTPSKVTNAQRASQVPPREYRPPTRRGRRTKGDTERYVEAARTQARIAARNAVKNTPREDS